MTPFEIFDYYNETFLKHLKEELKLDEDIFTFLDYLWDREGFNKRDFLDEENNRVTHIPFGIRAKKLLVKYSIKDLIIELQRIDNVLNKYKIVKEEGSGSMNVEGRMYLVEVTDELEELIKSLNGVSKFNL